MAAISIVQEHALTLERARSAAQSVADKIAREYGLACRWDGNVLRFERSGVTGALTLQEHQAHMSIKLGFPMSVMAATIKAKVAEKMRKVFTQAV
ncbi:MAG: polyhydroxyalkanoic acid system family protein [Gammaproteobacteria bacterium]